MQTPTPAEERLIVRLCSLLDKLQMCCHERTDMQSAAIGLPQAELRCLMLFGSERYLTPKGISERMNVSKGRVTRILEGLITKNLVRRVRDPEDSRVWLLTLTPEGTAKRAEIDRFQSMIAQQLLQEMPEEEREAIVNVMERFKECMVRVKEQSGQE